MRWRWLLALVPLGVGVALAWPAAVLVPGMIVRLRADPGTLAALAGLCLSLLVAAGLVIAERGRHQSRSEAQTHAAEERRRFVLRLDHEIKNPLTAMRAALANLAAAPDPATRRAALDSISAQAMRISRLTADLRKLAELETRPLECSSFDMAELLQQAVEIAQDRPEAGARRIVLTLPQAPWPLPFVVGDQDLLFLAVHNLLDNALKYGKTGDTVEVRAFEDGIYVVVEVADTGLGIPDTDLPHVWEELYRGEGARGVPGSGLGLALVRAIVERHGGHAAVRSRAGQGTVVSLRLPAR